MQSAWHARKEGLVVAVRAQPRARRDAILGVTADAAGVQRLRIAVTAPPDGGRATEAVRAVLAKAAGVAASRVAVLSGAGAREKLLLIEGDAVLLAARLNSMAACQPGNETA